ncbi:MAG TPA: MGMT family protein [bacterium]|nr:MGMT family protein [bacterium]
MDSIRTHTTVRRSCRLGPHWVAVEWRGGKLSGIFLGVRGPRDDSKLAKDLERVLDGGSVPDYLQAETSGLRGFRRKVLDRCARIPSGQVMTYAELAGAAGSPRGARAAGQVMANNPFALLIPCHRVVGSDYALHGFGGGLDMKEWLLAREGWQVEGIGTGRRLKSRAKGQEPRAKTVSRKRVAEKLGG